MLIYSLISLVRHLGWFGTSLQGGCGVGGPTPAAISARACYRAATMFYTNQMVTGRGLSTCISEPWRAPPRRRQRRRSAKRATNFGLLKEVCLTALQSAFDEF